MRLERLRIAGFKSFSDRAELDFDVGVTAIVGPNGCGKSNVADAIIWVMGEQSAKSLRGERMEDVIFSGSDGRKPGGAAEVRLRLVGLPVMARSVGDSQADDDTAPLVEFQPEPAQINGNGNGHGTALSLDEGPFTRDVEVTRRLYRSGESEYLIDGEVCRLRDVHELLMDTGLGAKAYSIIEQGKIGMILSSRPTDRRQLIEEAAGITKYKSRRRSAELKLEAAQQNLTRVDDIVYEVERQHGTLKRQAAKARRYRRLSDELHRWEKVRFAGQYRGLSQSLAVARQALDAAREREVAAAARVAEVEATVGRLRIEQSEADAKAAELRTDAHTREIDMNRRHQQVDFDRQQAESLAARLLQLNEAVGSLEQRREPAHAVLESRRTDVGTAERAREDALAALARVSEELTLAQGRLEGLEGDVEAARGAVFSVLNAATALRHALEHASGQRERVTETLSRLDLECEETEREATQVADHNRESSEALARATEAIERLRLTRAARESELAATRADLEGRTRDLRAGEQELARVSARLTSLEEVHASRSDFSDAARTVLVQANGHVGQLGAVADYLDVDPQYERAVEACLGELLQHVIVERHDQAAAGLSLVRNQDAGRCGFVVIDPGSNGFHPHAPLSLPGTVPLSQVVSVVGPHAATIQKVMPEAYVADDFESAVACARQTSAPVVTLTGDVLRGPHLVSGGLKVESRGIFATRREVKDLRTQVQDEHEAVKRLMLETEQLGVVITQKTSDIIALDAEMHRQEKAVVGLKASVARLADEAERLSRKLEVVARERARADEERQALDARQAEAHQSLARLADEQSASEGRLAEAQRVVFELREQVGQFSNHVAEARATHAGLAERALGLTSEVSRLEEGARELEERIAAHRREIAETEARREDLLHAVAAATHRLDDDVRALEDLTQKMHAADDVCTESRRQVEAQEAAIREARATHDVARTDMSELAVAQATAESDLTHLAQTCLDAVHVTLDEVLTEVEHMEAAGETTPGQSPVLADEADIDDSDGEGVISDEVVEGQGPDRGGAQPSATMTADEMIAALQAKIDRLGPVNMIAIEQFDELEARHVFLTTQRQDLIDSIAQTAKAIARINETSRARFSAAFTAIQQNFQKTFSTLFGGGQAGLRLLDEDDPLESGIDILASPPGKRLQSVQLLSGGEKALTAIALMFAIFRYKPSPFCLLDEIDAPLDDANVGRFVEMLQGMLDHTQFILITHNRQTMEIANRLYGVTMEEPGVSKLVSVDLH